MGLSFSHSITPKEKVGRNDPCPCGSGKKYKKCCLLTEKEKKYSATNKSGHISKIMDWTTQQEWFNLHVQSLLLYFYGDAKELEPDQLQPLMELAIFDRYVGTQTPLEMFVSEANLDKSVREYYQKWIDQQLFSIFKVISVDLGNGLEIEDVLDPTGTTYSVMEVSATYTLKPGMQLFSRIVPHHEAWMFSGGLMAHAPDQIVKSLEQVEEAIVPSLELILPVVMDLDLPELPIEAHYSEEAARTFLKLVAEELQIDQIKKALENPDQDIDARAILSQIAKQNLNQDQTEHLLNLIMRFQETQTENTTKTGPVEKRLVKQLHSEIIAADLAKFPTKADKFTQKWLDKPRKQDNFKTARELILEERHGLGNQSDEIGYEFFKHEQTNPFTQAVELMQADEYLAALTTYADNLSEIDMIEEEFRVFHNIGNCLIHFGAIELAEQYFQKALSIAPSYTHSKEILKQIQKQKLRDNIVRVGLHLAWDEFIFEIDQAKLSIQTDVQLLQDMQVFLQYIEDKSPKITQKKQDLQLKHVRAINQQLTKPDPEKRGKTIFRQESNFPKVRLMHQIGLVGGLIRRYKGGLKLSRRGQAFLSLDKSDQLSNLLQIWWQELDWVEIYNFGTISNYFQQLRLRVFQDGLLLLFKLLDDANGFRSINQLNKAVSPQTQTILSFFGEKPNNETFVTEVLLRLEWAGLVKLNRAQTRVKLTKLGRQLAKHLLLEYQENIPLPIRAFIEKQQQK